jgi:peptide subunit release factor 1 (eRF1)
VDLNNKDHVLGTLRQLTQSIKDRNKTPEEAAAAFRTQVSKQQLEYCLLDEDIDADDARAVREMLKLFYGITLEHN